MVHWQAGDRPLPAQRVTVSGESALWVDPAEIPAGRHRRSSNFNRNVLKRAYPAIGWRDADGNGRWTWHSLRHVFCTTALFTWKLDPTDVSCMAGHANVRTTLLMYLGSTAGVLGRARQATD
jgi:integrase